MVHSILRHESNSHTCAMRDPSRRTAGVRIRVTLLGMKLSSENFRMYTFVCDLKAVNVPNYIMKKRDYDKIFKGSEIFPRNSASRAFTKTVEGRARVVPHTIAWDLSRAIKSPRLLTRNRAQRRLTRFIAVRLQVIVSSVEGNARIRGTNFDHAQFIAATCVCVRRAKYASTKVSMMRRRYVGDFASTRSYISLKVLARRATKTDFSRSKSKMFSRCGTDVSTPRYHVTD